MKYIILVLFYFISVQILTAQNIVTLNLPNPCSISDIKDNFVREKKIDFTIYPNPAEESFTIDIFSPEKIGNVKIQLMNMQGLIVYNEKIFSGNSSCIKSVFTGNLPPGLYVVSVIRENETVNKKLIKR